MEDSANREEGRDLVVNAIALQAVRKENWQSYAAKLMDDYGITFVEINEFIAKNGPHIKAPFFKSSSLAAEATNQFMREIEQKEKTVPIEQQLRNFECACGEKDVAISDRRDLVLKFATTKNPLAQCFYFLRLMFQYGRSGNKRESKNVTQKSTPDFSSTIYKELLLFGLILGTIYLVFPYLPGIVFSQSFNSAMQFMLYWAFFRYIVIPTIWFFGFVWMLLKLRKLDSEERKKIIAKWQSQLKLMFAKKGFWIAHTFLLAMCPVLFMNSQHPYVFQSQSWSGLLMAGAVIWIVQSLVWLAFREK